MIVHGCPYRLMSGMDVSAIGRAASPASQAANHAPPSPRSTAAHSRDGRCQPCNRLRPTGDLRSVTGRMQMDRRGHNRREAGLTAFGPALTMRPSRGWWPFRQPPTMRTPASSDALRVPRAVADGVKRGRAERSGPARPRASSARAPPGRAA